jgi:hypothetical protein
MWPIETAPLLGSNFFLTVAEGGGEVLGIWEGLYKMGLSASNCREEEDILLYPCR